VKSILSILFMVISLTVFGQIRDITVRGNYITVFGENNKVLTQKYIQSDADFIGSSDKIFVIRRGNYVKVYDCHGKKMSQLYIDKDSRVTWVYSNGFNLRVGSYIKRYDVNCRQKSQRYTPNGNN